MITNLLMLGLLFTIVLIYFMNNPMQHDSGFAGAPFKTGFLWA